MSRSSPSSRLAVLLVVAGLVIGACTPGTVTPTPGQPSPTATAAQPTATAAQPTATAAQPTPVGEAVNLRWYCCLGTGEAPEMVPVEEEVAADFSAQHPNATLTFEAITYAEAYNTLSTQIAAGNPPDVVGPAGVGGLEAFHGQWLDLAPYIASSGFDLSAFDPGAVEFYNTPEGQIGVPFAIYPSMLWYNTALFDEAELNYPPHQYGEPYVMPDGTEREWNYDTVREIALILTVDDLGNDATSPDFNPDAIVQSGFEPQRDDLRQTGALFGAGSLLAEDGVTARVPDAWRDAWHYFYDAMWTDHFTLTGPVYAGEEWSATGYAFHSGNVAMSTNYLWSKYGVGADSGVAESWDIAAMPSHNGVVTAPLNADTFVVHKDTRNPQEAFDALAFLLTDAAPTLTTLYGAMPAIEAQQDAFFAALDEEFPHGPDWQVAKDSVAFADNPSFESFVPKYNETLAMLNQYGSNWQSTPGLDLDAQITALEADIQAIWDAP